MWNDIMTAEYPVAGGIIHEYLDTWWAADWSRPASMPIEIDENTHNEKNVHEWFGIVGLEGKSSKNYSVRKRKAFYRVRDIFNGDAKK